MLDALVHNWPLKLLAAALALGIWVSVTGEKRVVRDYPVPLDIRLPDTRILTGDPPNTVTVRLRGAEGQMRRLDSVPMELTVDLQDSAPGDRDVQLTRFDLSGVPDGIEVDFIDPDRLSLFVDRRERRELPVEPAFLGQPPDGYAFYGAEVVPRRVWVDGPESEVQPLEIVRTNPIRLDRRRQPFAVRVGPVPGGPNVRVVDPQPIEVRVDVDASPVDRKVDEVAVELLGDLYVSEATPPTLSVVLSGPPSLIDRIRADQIQLLADVTGLAPGDKAHSVAVRSQLLGIPAAEAKRITIKSVSRRNVTVRISDSTPLEGSEGGVTEG